MVSAIRLIGIAFIQLVEVDDLCFPIGKAHIAKSCNGVGGGSVLEQAVAKKQAEVFRIIFRQAFLFVSQRKDGVRKVGFTIIADRVDVHVSAVSSSPFSSAGTVRTSIVRLKL